MRVVPAFDVVVCRKPSLGVRCKAVSREVLDLERGEKALGHRVVVGIAT